MKSIALQSSFLRASRRLALVLAPLLTGCTATVNIGGEQVPCFAFFAIPPVGLIATPICIATAGQIRPVPQEVPAPTDYDVCVGWRNNDIITADRRNLDCPAILKSESAKNRQIEVPQNQGYQGCRYVGGVRRCDAPEPETQVALASGAGLLAGTKSPSEKKHDATQSQSAGSVKIGILPPAFINPTLPSNADKELDIYSEIRRYIQSNPSFEVSFDYGVGYGVGSSGIHAVWQGSVVKKVPDKAKMKAIGGNLGVDILVLAWITGNRTNASIDLYVFDVASGRMHQGTDNLGRAKGLVESTFALAKVTD